MILASVWRQSLGALVVMSVVSCSSSNAGPNGCDTTRDCVPGEICAIGVCHTVCTTNAHCSSGEHCVAELCVPDIGDTSGGDSTVGDFDDVLLSEAQFVSQTVPTEVTAGATFNVQIVMRNTGTTLWSDTAGYALASINPVDNGTWGTSRIAVGSGSTVAPNATYTFSSTLTAPATSGTYAFQWQMQEDGSGPFGIPTTSVSIFVGPGGSPTYAGTYTSSPVDFLILNGGYIMTALAYDERGSHNYVVASTENSATGYHPHVLTIHSNGAGANPTIGANVAFDDLGGTHGGHEMDVAAGWDSTGGLLLAVWKVYPEPCPPGQNDVVGQRFRANTDGSLALVGGTFDISNEPNVNNGQPCVGFDLGTEKFFVAYTSGREAGLRSDGTILVGRTVGTDGTVGPELRMAGVERQQVGCVVAGGNGKTMVSWVDFLNDWGPSADAGYRVRLIDHGALGPEIPGLRFGEIITQRPGLAYNRRTNEWLLAGQVGGQIHTWVYTADGTIRGSEITAAAPAHGAGVPYLAWSRTTNSYMMTYHDWFGTWKDAWAQELDPDGAPVGASFNLNAATPAQGTYFTPIAASTETSELLAVTLKDYNRLNCTQFNSSSSLP